MDSLGTSCAVEVHVEKQNQREGNVWSRKGILTWPSVHLLALSPPTLISRSQKHPLGQTMSGSEQSYPQLQFSMKHAAPTRCQLLWIPLAPPRGDISSHLRRGSTQSYYFPCLLQADRWRLSDLVKRPCLDRDKARRSHCELRWWSKRYCILT